LTLYSDGNVLEAYELHAETMPTLRLPYADTESLLRNNNTSTSVIFMSYRWKSYAGG